MVRGTDGRRRVAVVACLVLLAAVVPAVGSAPAVGATRGPSLLAQQTTPTGNNTTRHVDPETLEGNGDVGSLERWLAGQMQETLVNCSQGVQIGRYDACNQLNRSYPDWLSKYVEIEAQTADDRNTSDSFRQVVETQRTFVNKTREFRETLAAYREAKRAGNTTRARRLARRLNRLAMDINTTQDRLVGTYRRIANRTGANVTAAITSVNTTTANVTATAANVSAAEFIEPQLQLAAYNRVVSFDAPLVMTGTLRAPNGTPLADRRIVLRVGTARTGIERVTTTTGANGSFRLRYRPRNVSPGNRTAIVRFAPHNTSIYAGAALRGELRIRRTNVTVTTNVTPGQAGFGDTVIVRGRITTVDLAASEVAVRIGIAGRTVTRVRTDETGRFRADFTLPAGVPTGDRSILVTVTSSALESADATAPLSVQATTTRLTVSEVSIDDGQAHIRGRLGTVGGRAVPDQPVRLRLAGTDLGAVRTGPDGRFETTVSLPAVLVDGGARTAALVARFDGAGTNLEPANATATVRLEGPGDTQGLIGSIGAALADLLATLRARGLVALGGAALVVTLLLLLGYRDRLRRRLAARRDDAAGSQGETPADRSVSGSGTATLDEFRAWLRTQFDEGHIDRGIDRAYRTVRNRLAEEFDLRTGYTHWEFYTACRDAGLDEARVTALRELTAAYERVAFAPEAPTAEVGERALAAVRQLLGTDESTSRDAVADD